MENSSSEVDKRQCKACGEFKIRIRSGRYPNAKDSVFVDIEGKQWSGNVCPQCHVERTKNKQKERRKRIREQLKKDLEFVLPEEHE